MAAHWIVARDITAGVQQLVYCSCGAALASSDLWVAHAAQVIAAPAPVESELTGLELAAHAATDASETAAEYDYAGLAGALDS
jgi:hypothetical protein